MENRFECGICPRSFELFQARGRHYLEDHGDQWLAILYAKWDGVVQEEEVHQPIVPLRALPRVAPPRDETDFRESGTTSNESNHRHRLEPVSHQSTRKGTKSDHRDGAIGHLLQVQESRDISPHINRKLNVPHDGGTHVSSEKQQIVRVTSVVDEPCRVIIIQNIPGWLTADAFCSSFIIPFGGVYRDIAVFHSITNQAQSTSTAFTTVQIEFYTQETAIAFRNWLMIAAMIDGLQLAVELAETMIQMPPTQGPPQLKAYDQDAEDDDDEGTLFIKIEGAPPRITRSEVMDFFRKDKAKLRPVGVDVLRDEHGQCNGTILCEFPTFMHAQKATTLFRQKALKSQEVSISLISEEEKLCIISRWELRNKGPHEVATMNYSGTARSYRERVGKPGATVVLLGNIPYKATKAKIHHHVQNILRVPIDIQQIDMKFQEDGVKGTGAVHLIMETMADALKAKKKLSKSLLMNRYIRTAIRYNL